ncbi:BQ5605_C002g01381 [Microbotryum silenes-dioicae]|uniref:3,4-dihydroxy-2-butanone 4-phosphate synthase n=1 Tax=Microbotryum silenes-dioicae TaxID=796604 RepID=A0A2X0M2H3_9BASI|nr:BQ5605_C002g01381 [Microbotryum silenes-dioicae]
MSTSTSARTKKAPTRVRNTSAGHGHGATPPASTTSSSSATALATASASASASASSAPSTQGAEEHWQLDSIEDALVDIRRGEFVVVVDDMDRENEGDLIIAAHNISTEQMAWLIRHSSGYICICLPAQRLEELDIKMMVEDNQDKNKTAYTVTVDYRHGTTTGISAHDRALTAVKLTDPSSTAADFSRPGHLVPLRAVDGGVLARKGHTEASIDLCRLAGLPPAGIICELVKADDPMGSMARRDDCFKFARDWGLKMISIEQIEQYRKQKGL